MVRLVSAAGLSKLMPYSKKVDSVLGDILNGIEEVVNEYEPTNEQMEIAEAMLKSLQGSLLLLLLLLSLCFSTHLNNRYFLQGWWNYESQHLGFLWFSLKVCVDDLGKREKPQASNNCFDWFVVLA